MPIITTAEFKTFMDYGDEFDAVLDVLIPAVQSDLEKSCGRVFDETVYTDEAYDGKGQPSIWIPNKPVTSLTAVKLLDSSGTTTTLASTSYRLNSITGELMRLNSVESGWEKARRLSVWPDELQNVLVSYTGGYADADMPEGLKLLMYDFVTAALLSRGNHDWKRASHGDGVMTRTYLNSTEYQAMKAIQIRPWITGLVV